METPAELKADNCDLNGSVNVCEKARGIKCFEHKDHKGDKWNVVESDFAAYLRFADPKYFHAKNRGHNTGFIEQCLHGKRWDSEFSGIESLEKARTMRFWPEGREWMAKLSLNDVPLPSVSSISRVRRWSNDGDDVCIDRMRAGFDDFFITRKRMGRLASGGHIVRISVDFCASCMIQAKDLIWSGVAACKIIDILEDAGYRVEFDAIHCTTNLSYNTHGYNAVDFVHVKTAENPLSLDAIMMTAHPAFLRYFGFCSDCRRGIEVGAGHGHVIDVPEHFRGDIHIEKAFTKEKAEEVVRKALALVESGCRSKLMV